MKLLTTSVAAVALIALAGCNRGTANNSAGNTATPAPAGNSAEGGGAKPPAAPESNTPEPAGNEAAAGGGEKPAGDAAAGDAEDPGEGDAPAEGEGEAER